MSLKIKVVYRSYAILTTIPSEITHARLAEIFRGLFNIDKDQVTTVGYIDGVGDKVILNDDAQVTAVVSDFVDGSDFGPTPRFFILTDAPFEYHDLAEAITARSATPMDATPATPAPEPESAADPQPPAVDLDHLRAVFEAFIQKLENKGDGIYDSLRSLAVTAEQAASLAGGRAGPEIDARVDFEVERGMRQFYDGFMGGPWQRGRGRGGRFGAGRGRPFPFYGHGRHGPHGHNSHGHGHHGHHSHSPDPRHDHSQTPHMPGFPAPPQVPPVSTKQLTVNSAEYRQPEPSHGGPHGPFYAPPGPPPPFVGQIAYEASMLTVDQAPHPWFGRERGPFPFPFPMWGGCGERRESRHERQEERKQRREERKERRRQHRDGTPHEGKGKRRRDSSSSSSSSSSSDSESDHDRKKRGPSHGPGQGREGKHGRHH